MFSPEYLQQLSRDAAKKAARANKKPYVIFNREEIDSYPPFPFPNLGDHRPKGWTKREDDLFVDASGFGAEGEPALTVGQFMSALRRLTAEAAKESKTIGFAIVQEGQFQAYVGVFERRD